MSAIDSALARKLVVSTAVETAFRGRKGHGGGDCTKRVLSRGQLAVILEATLIAYTNFRVGESEKRGLALVYDYAHADFEVGMDDDPPLFNETDAKAFGDALALVRDLAGRS